ncbi:acyl-ACP--UDP-N-acetylglucosamine O-acyltransferase [Maricaulis sp.]|uniref:acyl-ACP--UDP-N-acetylglucosamine O-acyltransferase n=1 Tax=unclassified Maricaulis TaxID=2632371 RepID=UPI001B0194A9|nr:acyl-ACP--UDP-N-acetylglucosamine O-acyltransferase [Maricaulis sp.]MBO6797800.1 acyl-ACP--UDP-N-acetylglucosamine O-acyltransferase [Maricaulis sp.]
MSAKIHPSAVVDPAAELGQDVEIGPFCVIGPKVVLKDRVRVISNATVAGLTEVGHDCVLYPGVHLGHPPQDFKYQGEDTTLTIGDRNVMRENVTMHPGTSVGGGATRIGHDGYFMVGAHVSHDSQVGDRVVFANGAAIGGCSHIEDHVILGGYAGIHQFSRIGRHAFIGAMAMVTADVIPYGSVIGNHAHLAGLNVVGLKRRGMPRETLRELRTAYRLLFAEEGTFQERLDDVARDYSENAPVMEIINFIRAADAKRSLCMPNG